jgi:cellulose synthase/poly-beta-1,6-N-acetylglucosamine synthase-like glycosyltransferase
MKLSVLIPVYKKPKLAGEIVAKLLRNTYEEKEIFVVVDGPTNPEIEAALDPHRASIRIRYNGEQFGKAKSLNELERGMTAEGLVFLDNDIDLPDDPEFLHCVAKQFERHDIMEFPKEGKSRSFVGKIAGLEFLSTAISSFLFATIANRCPGMNGAAFAVKRELFEKLGGFRYMVNEDIDMAFRAFLGGAKFSYSPSLKVLNHLPDDPGEWLSQRKRWAINNVTWFLANFREIAKNFFKDEKFRRAALMMILPVIVYSALFYGLHLLGLTSLYPFIGIVGMQHHFILSLLIWLAHWHLVMDGAIPMLLGFGITLAFNFILARILRFRFNFLAFLFYYVIYMPVWMAANLVFGLGVLLGVKFKTDWKVAKPA